MRILLHSCVKNEAERYWSSWLDWHVLIFGADNVHVYDDNSSDDTLLMASEAGVATSVRGRTEPSFLEHEGKFRQHAWEQFERRMKPERGDWVFCIDADEFLVGREDENASLYRACEWANHQRRGALTVSIPEVFRTDLQDGKLTNLHVRVDGWWGKIAGTRLFAWRPDGRFADKAMGCGSEPTYVASAPRSSLQGLWLLHFGYARPEDVQAKYERYRSLSAHGHADSHVESIPQEPSLVRWMGPTVDVYLGRRPEPGPGVVVAITSEPMFSLQAMGGVVAGVNGHPVPTSDTDPSVKRVATPNAEIFYRPTVD